MSADRTRGPAESFRRIGYVFSNENIPFVRLDGSLSQKQRERVLAEFNNPKRACVLLLSLKAGGVGLNLVIASTVLLTGESAASSRRTVHSRYLCDRRCVVESGYRKSGN